LSIKYVLLFVETEQFEQDLEAMSQADRDRAFELVYKWMADHADLTANPAEQALLRCRIDWGDDGG
jgi:hypothetical protein